MRRGNHAAAGRLRDVDRARSGWGRGRDTGRAISAQVAVMPMNTGTVQLRMPLVRLLAGGRCATRADTIRVPWRLEAGGCCTRNHWLVSRLDRAVRMAVSRSKQREGRRRGGSVTDKEPRFGKMSRPMELVDVGCGGVRSGCRHSLVPYHGTSGVRPGGETNGHPWIPSPKTAATSVDTMYTIGQEIHDQRALRRPNSSPALRTAAEGNPYGPPSPVRDGTSGSSSATRAEVLRPRYSIVICDERHTAPAGETSGAVSSGNGRATVVIGKEHRHGARAESTAMCRRTSVPNSRDPSPTSTVRRQSGPPTPRVLDFIA